MVATPGGTPWAVLRRPLTILEISGQKEKKENAKTVNIRPSNSQCYEGVETMQDNCYRNGWNWMELDIIISVQCFRNLKYCISGSGVYRIEHDIPLKYV